MNIAARPGWRAARLGLGAALVLPLSALAQPTMLYILDGSGSMWGRAGGEPKIAAAKRVLQELIRKTPDGIRVGLMAYGHRRKGDCDDIELLAAPGGDRHPLVGRVADISPKGKTPISAALQTAGGQLATNENPSTLVLVSDGLETCGGDPCATAAALRDKGLDLVIHVVGLDVDKPATEQLQCIADAGGGRYFSAADAADLREALDRVKQSVVDAKPLPAAPTRPKVAETRTRSKRIRIAGPGRVRLVPAEWVRMPPNYWALHEVESGMEKARARDVETRVKAGEYQIVWRQSEHGHSEVPLSAVATVSSGQTTEVALDTGLRLTLPEGLGPPRWWGLAEAGAEEPLFRVHGSTGPELTPSGDYRLLWRQAEHGSRTLDLGPVQVQDGRLNDLVLNSGIVLQTADWMGDSKPYYYRLLNDTGEVAGEWRDLGPQLAPVGTYSLVYRPSEHRHRDIRWGEVTLTHDGITPVALDSGIRFIPEAGTKPPYRVFFVNQDNGNEVVMSDTWDPLPLPPGRYRLDWWESQHGSQRETLADGLVVDPGVLLELEI